MKQLLIVLIMLFTLSSVVKAESSAIKPYQKGDWASILKSADGKALAVHFWGVTCAPCVKEMPQWGQFLSQDKNAQLIFIQVDDSSPEMVKKVLTRYRLAQANNYSLISPFDDYLRYEIDPQWRGETPMTLLIDKEGKVVRNSGPINFIELKKWFNKAI